MDVQAWINDGVQKQAHHLRTAKPWVCEDSQSFTFLLCNKGIKIPTSEGSVIMKWCQTQLNTWYTTNMWVSLVARLFLFHSTCPVRGTCSTPLTEGLRSPQFQELSLFIQLPYKAWLKEGGGPSFKIVFVLPKEVPRIHLGKMWVKDVRVCLLVCLFC